MKIENFKHFLTKVKLPLFIFVLPATQAGATIIEADDPVFGVGSLTRDTDQALDFLDVVHATGLTIAYVESQFGAGDDFEGFRYATNDEMVNLVNNWGFLPGAAAHVNVTGNTGTDQIGGLIDLLGPTATSWIDLTIGSTSTSTLGLYNYTDLGPGNDDGVYWNGRNAGGNNHFLVRESLASNSAVPDNGTTVTLFALALLGLMTTPKWKSPKNASAS